VLPTTSQAIKKYGLDAKKSLGQNFILDSNLTDKIARQAGSLEGFEILEIGGGPGGLTKSILKLNPKKLTVIEQDERCIAALEEIQTFYPDQLEIINGDALKFNIKEHFGDKKIKIIANLPYNIASVLLFKWLENIENIELMVLMFQKEVVQRIVAKTGDRHYGRMAVMVNFLCKSKRLFDISASSFTPAPKVTSSLALITPRENKLMDVDLKKLEKITAAAFSQRRKKVKAGLKSLVGNSEEFLNECGIDSNLRAEQLSLEQFGKLALGLKKV
jgi:16S rRNA (adenine1518-N6/adenine1519-N6)-dimethyltransferase